MVKSTVEEVLASLADAPLAESVKDAVLELVSDDAGASASPLDAGDPIYLTSVEVEGFRGVGPVSRLELQPGPGLTLVVGSNGCGKSTFAEAVERTLTGSTSRWATAASDAQENWRNVHHTGPTRVKVGMRRASEKVDTSALVTWREGDGFLHGQQSFVQKGSGEPPAWAATNWSRPLEMYPPLLPYKNLSAVVDGKPSELFDQFDCLLGLEVLDGASSTAARLSKEAGERIKLEGTRKKAALAALKGATDVPGVTQLIESLSQEAADADRSSLLAASLVGGVTAGTDTSAFEQMPALDLKDIRYRVDEMELLQVQLAELEKADAARNERLADLLESALSVHTAGATLDCPVCHQGTLDDVWRAAAEADVQRLREQASAITGTRRQLTTHIAALRARVSGLAVLRPNERISDSDILRERVRNLHDELSGATFPADVFDRFTEVHLLMESCRQAAVSARDEAAERVRPIVEAVVSWAEASRGATGASEAKRTYGGAAEWLKAEVQRLREIRLAALNGTAHAIWEKLRQTCTIELGPLVLEGAKTRRRLELTCTTEGKEAMARSILSQGELHAIALSLFLPRATHASSPFGFIAIDDPVQALDRAKVDGLAEVLAELGESRQVVVFTHDDRLPDAVIRLGLTANVIRISRSEGSTVAAEYTSDQVERALKDAYTLAKDDAIEKRHALRAIAGCCRSAVEAKALQTFRRSKASQGMSVDEIDALLAQAGSSFWNRVSLGVFGEVRADARTPVVAKYGATTGRVLASLNSGGHELLSKWEPVDLVQETRRTVNAMFGE